MISVLIPSFRDGLLMQCLASMERSQPGSTSHVIVLDNGISEKLRKGLPQIRFVSVPADPFVFARAYNLGVAAAMPGWAIASLGDDTEILTPGWLDELSRLVDRWPDGYGAITLEETHTRENRPDYHGGLYHLPHVALGAGLVIPRGVLQDVGPWEEGLVGYGFDDFDYGLRLYHAGYSLGLTDVVRIKNVQQASGWVARQGSYDAMLKLLEVNRQIYHQKWWGTVPPLGRPELPTEAEHIRRLHCTCR